MSNYTESLRQRLRDEGYSDEQINEVFERYKAGVEYAERNECSQQYVLNLLLEKLHVYNK